MVISRDKQFHESKRWDRIKVPNNSMHNGENLRNIIYELQEEEVEEVVQGKEARRSSRARTK